MNPPPRRRRRPRRRCRHRQSRTSALRRPSTGAFDADLGADGQVVTCAQCRPADQRKADLPLAKPDGVGDFYVHCEANVDPGQEASAAQLASVLPIFAETFVKA
ncbi:hypothetical protein ACFWN2_21190 [Lentzea sp. NPDC058436]|uniref:hypothetical protein n=1 Tax=Lentzea sp. NPDC058436 TaxID=3346499 RepID=UPI00364BC929